MIFPSRYQTRRRPNRHGRPRSLRLESLEERRLLAVLTVDTDLDVVDGEDGLTSLREAIVTANSRPGADEIVFDFGHDGPATIKLEQGELQLTEAVTITGSGPELLTIDAQQQSRILNITAEDGDFAIEGMTLTNGKTTEGESTRDIFNGGAIRSLTHGALTIHNSALTNNSTAGSGGGVCASGDVTVSSSTILGNLAGYDGGGLYVSGDVMVHASTIDGNSGSTGASGHPGGGGNLLLGWRGAVAGGGGINGRNVTVSLSTISNNSEGQGGAISANNVTIISSTISQNWAFGYAGGAGGGVSADNVTVISSTISENHADHTNFGYGVGGGIYIRPRGGNVTIANSILAGNRDGGGGSDLSQVSGSLTVSYSLIGNNRNNDLPEAPVGSPDPNGNFIGGRVGGVIDALLGPLSDNGGLTFTHAVLPGSPAIDAGDSLAVAGSDGVPFHDQRGERFANGVDGNADGVARIDMGAFERQSLSAHILGVSSPTVTPVNKVTIQFTRDVNGFDLGDLRLSLNGGENLLTGDETLASSDNQTFVLSGMADAAAVAGYYTLTLMSTGSEIMALDGGQLDPGVSMSWAMGRSMLGLTVNTLTDEADGRIDDGDISLRDAITIAAPGETINFDASLDGGTILLTLGELVVTRPLIVDATELTNGLVIDSAGNDPTPAHDDGPSDPIFEIDDGNSLGDSPVTIRGLTLTGATGSAIHSKETLSIDSASIVGNTGGGIDALGDVNVSSSTISDNGGSGIRGKAVTVTSSTISGNSAFQGGGISAFEATVRSSIISGNSNSGISASEVTVRSSTIFGNSSDLGGGGIRANQVTVISSTISGNHADFTNFGYGGFGGGIVASNVTINSSTISGNSAQDGGGIRASIVAVSSSTISANNGGGISARADVTIDFSTIVGNFSRNGVGGVSGQNVNISNSIVAANRGTFADLESAESVIVEYSLIGDNRGTDLSEAPLSSPDTRGNLIGGPESRIIDPRLGPLTENGGPTFTHAVLPGSPAINMGDPSTMGRMENAPSFDQRGTPYARVVHGRVDMGAFERGIAGDTNGDGNVDFTDFLILSAHFGAGQGWSEGNFDGSEDGTQFADFVVLANNFGFEEPISDDVPKARRESASPSTSLFDLDVDEDRPRDSAVDHLLAQKLDEVIQTDASWEVFFL